MVIGNVKNESLEDIFFGEKRRLIQNIHEKRDFFQCGISCQKCDQLFSREDALVYSNKNRTTGQQIVSEDFIVRFEVESGK